MKRQAFTIAELMIVVIVLAILAALALPEYMGASTETRETALSADLQSARKQIELYMQQHFGRSPHLDYHSCPR